MRLLISLFGYGLIFFGVLLSIYDTMMSIRLGGNQFLSITSVIHYFKPGFVTSFQFGFRGKEFMWADMLWTEILLPLFGFPVCLLLLLLGLMVIRITVRRTAF